MRAVEVLDAVQPGDRGRAYVTLGDVFLATGDTDRARTLFEEGVELLLENGPRFALEPARRLADLLESEGDTAGALEVLKRATAASSTVTV